MTLKKPYLLLGCLLLCYLAAAIGTLFTSQAIPTWYASLTKPFFNPPNWIFGPVWSLLYTLMGISLYLITKNGLSGKRRVAASVFGVQLALNTLWSVVFFGSQNIFLGLLIILALWLAIAITIYKFWQLNRPAAYMLYPYLAWVSFATLLNYAILQLNP